VFILIIVSNNRSAGGRLDSVWRRPPATSNERSAIQITCMLAGISSNSYFYTKIEHHQ